MNSVFADAYPYIKQSDRVCDVGPGIRPALIYRAPYHLCIEPHKEYADWLEGNGYTVVRQRAREALKDIERVGVVFMLDVIEHMEKEEGFETIRIAREKSDQVVVFTPLGFKEQSYKDGEKDAWGMNGTYWQTHRSGWVPDEFPGWKIFSGHTSIPVFTAIWTR